MGCLGLRWRQHTDPSTRERGLVSCLDLLLTGFQWERPAPSPETCDGRLDYSAAGSIGVTSNRKGVPREHLGFQRLIDSRSRFPASSPTVLSAHPIAGPASLWEPRFLCKSLYHIPAGRLPHFDLACINLILGISLGVTPKMPSAEKGRNSPLHSVLLRMPTWKKKLLTFWSESSQRVPVWTERRGANQSDVQTNLEGASLS